MLPCLRDARLSLEKGQKELDTFAVLSKASVIHEKDKTWYKNLSNLCASYDKRAPACPADLSSSLMLMKKQLNAITLFAKNYKQWVRKGDDESFMSSHQELEKFLDDGTPIKMALPPCALADIMSVHFTAGLAAQLRDGKVDDIVVRWEFIGSEKLKTAVSSEEAAVLQGKCFEQVLVDLLGATNAAKVNEKELIMMSHSMVTLLKPFPFEPDDLSAMSFKLEPPLPQQLAILKQALVLRTDYTSEALSHQSDLALRIERGQVDEEHEMLGKFSSLANGVKLLRRIRERLQSIAKHKASSNRFSKMVATLSNSEARGSAPPVDRIPLTLAAAAALSLGPFLKRVFSTGRVDSAGPAVVANWRRCEGWRELSGMGPNFGSRLDSSSCWMQLACSTAN